MVDLPTLLPHVIAIAQRAGAEIMRIYNDEAVEVTAKTDSSPVTQADIAAHNIITPALRALTPEIPVISEEEPLPPYAVRCSWSHYWLVDPLDGTKDFIAHTKGFSVNIALIAGHEPILGVIVSPTEETCYYAAQSLGAFRVGAEDVTEAIRTRLWLDDQRTVVVVSRLHSDHRLAKFLAGIGDIEMKSMGSARKFCMIAEGDADFYPRPGQTCEWDTAAGQCLINEAGGAVVDLDGNPLRYNTKEDVFNPAFLVTGDLASLRKRFNFSKNHEEKA